MSERYPYQIRGKNIELVGEEKAVEKALDRLNRKPEIELKDVRTSEIVTLLRVLRRNGYSVEVKAETDIDGDKVNVSAQVEGEYENE